VAAPKPTWIGSRGPKPRNMWQRRNPSQYRGEIQSYKVSDITWIDVQIRKV
jgi:hypothetical protein